MSRHTASHPAAPPATAVEPRHGGDAAPVARTQFVWVVGVPMFGLVLNVLGTVVLR